MEREKILSFNFTKNMRNYEGFENFLSRIFSFQRAEFSFGTERFVPSNSVIAKVEDNRSFSRFIGDTIVFNLSDEQKSLIFAHYIKPLYEVAPQCFAEMLQEHTLHMTLHDLNATNTNDYETLKKMFDTEISIAHLIDRLKTENQTIDMVTTCAFNMVNTSIVLGLKPKTEEDYKKLMRLYCHIEGIHELPYPFTPHITLAYFNRQSFDGKLLQEVERVINSLNGETVEISLSTERLFYQKFVSMNDYFNILPFVK